MVSKEQEARLGQVALSAHKLSRISEAGGLTIGELHHDTISLDPIALTANVRALLKWDGGIEKSTCLEHHAFSTPRVVVVTPGTAI